MSDSFKKHLYRFAVTVGAVVVAAVPAFLADPNVKHYIENHPWVALYIPVVAAIVRTLYTAWTDSSLPSPPSP